MPIGWRHEISLGHAEIDRQHQELRARVNSLLEAMQDGRGPAETTRLLEYLTAYANEHFALEEREMEDAGYPGAVEHAKAHAAFARDVEELKHEMARMPDLAWPVLQVQRRVCDWLVDHVGRMDADFAAFYRARALAPSGAPRGHGAG